MTEKLEIDLDALERAAYAVQEWSNCNQAWLDTSEDTAAAVVGHIDDDGNPYPVATIDCDQYFSGDSLALAKFYAAANPAAVLELILRLREAESRLHEVATHCATAEQERDSNLRMFQAAIRDLAAINAKLGCDPDQGGAEPILEAIAALESELAACREKAHSHSFIGRAIAQEERACRAEDALVDIVNQIRKSSPIDDHGHSFLMNMAYLKAVELLDAARAKEGGVE